MVIGNMRILVVVSRPSHAHFYRQAVVSLRDLGHEVTLLALGTATSELLDGFDITHTALSPGSSPAGPARKVLSVLRELVGTYRKPPDVVTAVDCGPLVRLASLFDARTVLFPDGSTACRGYTAWFVDEVHVPRTASEASRARQVTYDGRYELSYLHPSVFEPDTDRLREAGIDPEETYYLSQLPSKERGPAETDGPSATTRRLVRSYLDDNGRCLQLTADGAVRDLSNGRSVAPATVCHDALACADLYLGTDARRASEAALVGTPTLLTASEPVPEVADLKEYGLLDVVREDVALLERVFDLVPNPAASGVWRQRRDAYLDDCVDVPTHVVEALATGGGERRRTNVGARRGAKSTPVARVEEPRVENE